MTTTDIKTMNADEDYGFDISGFIHLQQVLTAEEVAACNQAIDGAGQEMPPLQELLEHPILQNYVKALCGDAFSLDQPPSLVTGSETNGKETFSAGDPETNRRLRYICHGDVRVCNGLRVIVALAPSSAEGGLVLVPASHKRAVPPSPNFLSGAGDIGMTEQPVLAAGDVLLCAATTISAVRGWPQRLLEIRYISGRVMPTGGFPEVEAPDWMAELTPGQKAVVGLRTTGRGGKVISDREKIWVADEVEQPASVSFNLDEYSMPDPDELWFWDIRGYLVVRGVMDAEWLTAANAAIDFAAANAANLPEGHPSAIEEVPEQALRENDWEWPEDTSPRLRGDINRPRIGGLYQLPAPHCDPFRRMIAHPAVAQRLNWMLGYGFRESGEPMCCVYPKGTTGGSLHGQNPGGYSFVNGRQLVEQVNVAWALHDEVEGFGENSGGFLCVPGSHKAMYTIPRPLHTSIDLPQVYKPGLKAGDVLFFGAVAHGTTAWRADWYRHTVIQFMGSTNAKVRPADNIVGWRWSTAAENPKNILEKQ